MKKSVLDFRTWGFPDWITWSRLLCIPGLYYSLQHGIFLGAWMSCLWAAVSDFLDGWLARLWKEASPFGALLDATVDKCYLTCVSFFLWHFGKMPSCILVALMAREFFLLLLIFGGKKRGLQMDLRSLSMGKIYMALLFLWFLLNLVDAHLIAQNVIIGLSLSFGFLSFIEYFFYYNLNKKNKT